MMQMDEREPAIAGGRSVRRAFLGKRRCVALDECGTNGRGVGRHALARSVSAALGAAPTRPTSPVPSRCAPAR